jgi:general secretion pathway protein B
VVELRAPTPPTPPEAQPAWKSLPLWPLVPDRILRQVKERLVLNVHVYNDQPEDRFVLLNMKKYREGEQISDGLKLEQITSEGVVLAVPNGRFRLGSR